MLSLVQAPNIVELRDTAERTSFAVHRTTLEKASRATVLSIESSPYLSAAFQFSELSKRLQDLTKTPPDWNSYGSPAPNHTAIKNAAAIMDGLRLNGPLPDRVLPSADGGVAITFVSDTASRAVIESLNDGESFILLYDLQGGSKTIAWPVNNPKEQLDSLGIIQAHLRSPGLATQR